MDTMREFHLFCKNLYTFYNEDPSTSKRLYEEIKNNDLYAPVYDTITGVEIARHYYATKIIPPDLL